MICHLIRNLKRNTAYLRNADKTEYQFIFACEQINTMNVHWLNESKIQYLW